MPRIAPLEPPYPEATQALFDLAMPEGMDPLVLFRVLAQNERLLPRFMRGGILDKGPVPIRDREIVIHRTTARCGAEYEWGVHVNAFGRPLGLSNAVLAASVDGDANARRRVRILRMRHDDGLPVREVATALGDPDVAQVHVDYRRARREFAVHLRAVAAYSARSCARS